MADRLGGILDRYKGEEGSLIQVLLDVQNEYNWLPGEALDRVSQSLGVPRTYPYRVASFYKAMSLVPRGRHLVSVCLGTACHVRGGQTILEKTEQLVGVKAGQTTADSRFTLQRVNCLGCCALGPVMVVDGHTHGKVTAGRLEEVLQRYD